MRWAVVAATFTVLVGTGVGIVAGSGDTSGSTPAPVLDIHHVLPTVPPTPIPWEELEPELHTQFTEAQARYDDLKATVADEIERVTSMPWYQDRSNQP